MDMIEHLEYLSKLNFSEEEKAKFEGEFASIVEFVNEIRDIELPTDEIKDRTIEFNDLREDEVKESIGVNKALLNAPKKKDGCYVAPLVVE